MTIQFYKFGSQWGIADPSPFCVKLESYLRLAKIDFDTPKFSPALFGKSPKGKFPFMETEQGELIGDSQIIIERLVDLGNIDLDEPLNAEEKAISCAFQRMLDEHLYWALVYSRWMDEPGWSFISKMFFGMIPGFARGFIQKREQKKVIASLKGQGLGRHNRDEIYGFASRNIDALADYLSDKAYFFGKEKPTFIDIVLHAHMINIITPDFDTPLKHAVLAKQNLVDHTLRMDAEIYGDAYKVNSKQAA